MVKNKSYQIVPLSTLADLELLGTKKVVSQKPDQIKFYASEKTMEDCNRILGEQGLSLTEGMNRLIRLLIVLPAEMRPVVLQQAPGEAAKILARYVLKTPTTFTPPPADDTPATDPNVQFSASGDYAASGGGQQGPKKKSKRRPGKSRAQS